MWKVDDSRVLLDGIIVRAPDRLRLLEGLHREWGEWRAGDPQQIGELFVLGAILPGVVRGSGIMA